MLRCFTLALALSAATTALAAEDAVVSVDLLSKPLDMMMEEAAKASGAAVPAEDASASDRALGLFQRGFFADARTAALEAITLKDGAGAAMMLLATMNEGGLGMARDDEKAVSWLRKAAEAGNAEARHALAVRRLTGDGVEVDRKGATAELRALATERPSAAFDLAQYLLANGEAEGERWLEVAAEAGVPEAQYALGGLLMTRGSEVEAADHERARAIDWMVRAARGGLAEAQLELGLWLVEGRATQADPEAAYRWIERAALSGLPLARNRLAHMHRVGIGTRADPVRAARWHALARLDGVADGTLDDLVATLDRAARGRAFQGLPAAAVEAVTRGAPAKPTLALARERAAEGLPGVRLGSQ